MVAASRYHARTDSIRASSPLEKDRLRVAPTQSSTWLTRLAPMSALVTVLCRNTHASAICASVWPRDCARSFSFFVFASTASVMSAGRRNLGSWPARESAGMPLKYRSVSKPLASGEKTMQPMPSCSSVAQQLRLNPAIQHAVTRLMDEARRSQFAQQFRRARRFRRLIIREAGVKRLAAADGVGQRAHRFLQRRVGVGPVRIKNVHVIQPHPLERLVQRRQQIFARTPFAVRPRPHVITRLCGDDQFIAPFAEVVAQDAAKGFLRRAVRRAVIVREVKMRDAKVKRAAGDGAGVVVGIVRAEIVPEPQRNERQLDAGATAAAVRIPASRNGLMRVNT